MLLDEPSQGLGRLRTALCGNLSRHLLGGKRDVLGQTLEDLFLVLEVVIDRGACQAELLRNVLHAGAAKPTLDKKLGRRVEDRLA